MLFPFLLKGITIYFSCRKAKNVGWWCKYINHVVHSYCRGANTEYKYLKVLTHLLLRAKLVGVSTLLLPAILGPWRQPSITLATDHLITIECLCKSRKRRIKHPAPQSQDHLQYGLILYVALNNGTYILKRMSTIQELL